MLCLVNVSELLLQTLSLDQLGNDWWGDTGRHKIESGREGERERERERGWEREIER